MTVLHEQPTGPGTDWPALSGPDGSGRDVRCVLVNALSSTGMSGKHVVYGFLGELARQLAASHRFVLLLPEGDEPPADLTRPNIAAAFAPAATRGWVRRSAWEMTRLSQMARDLAADAVISPSGAALPNLRCPQVVLCMNPWCFVRDAQRGPLDRLKAAIQRRRYTASYRSDAQMVFLSDSLRRLYADAAGEPHSPCPSRHAIAFSGIDAAVYERAAEAKNTARDRHLIVAVSAMARWKGAETLVDAVARLRSRGVPARLRLVGPWPDADYETLVRSQIASHGLGDAVTLAGKLSRDELLAEYANAQVFSLPSGCESFGIPAAEAQVFGTPTVASFGRQVDYASAIPEVCGEGGRFVAHGDAESLADALQRLLTDEPHWRAVSDAARKNAEQFRWASCTRPFADALRVAAAAAERGATA